MEMLRLPTKFLGSPGSHSGACGQGIGFSSSAGRDARGEGRDSNEHVSRGESSAFDRGGSLLPSTPAVDLLVVANNDQDRVRGVRRGFAKLKHDGVSRLRVHGPRVPTHKSIHVGLPGVRVGHRALRGWSRVVSHPGGGGGFTRSRSTAVDGKLLTLFFSYKLFSCTGVSS